ncbi:MAG TPA: hypothetical protein HA257_09400 [Candidatus Methanoperedenaceae archaeon]|nr:hypothetical protein [Candidatus Methanoperedenaceae archaeon]
MSKQSVLTVLRDILPACGYSVSAPGIADILAEKDYSKIYIKYGGDIGYAEILHLARSMHGGRSLLVSDIPLREEVRKFAGEQGITVWDAEKLERWIGKAVLDNAEGKKSDLLAQADEQGAFGGFGSFFDAPVTDRAQPAPEMRIQAERTFFEPAEPASAAGSREIEGKIRIILTSAPVNISRANAAGIAESHVGDIKSQRIVFIPFWRYKYSFRVKKSYKTKIVDLSGNGEGIVNALSGENSFTSLRDVFSYADVPTKNYEIKKPAISKNDAVAKALELIIREHTQEVRLSEMIGDTIVYEKKSFSPDAEDIGITADLIHIPVWEILGVREVIEINAYDGHVGAPQKSATRAGKVYSDAEFL